MKTVSNQKPVIGNIKHRVFFAMAFFFTFAIFNQTALAAKVVYEDVGFVRGVEESSTQFSISQGGTYEAALIDFKFPVEFELLSFQLTAGSPSPLFEVDRLEGGGSFTFNANPGNYYANLIGVGGGTYEIGLYGLQISQLSSVVPLPPSVLLFLSCVLAMFLFGFNGNNPLEVERGWIPNQR